MHIFILIVIIFILLEEYRFPIYENGILKFKFRSQVDLKKIINNSTGGIQIWKNHKDGRQTTEVYGALYQCNEDQLVIK